MTRIRVVVTQADIAAAGNPGPAAIDAGSCPLARALRRRGFEGAAVGFSDWSFGDHSERYRLPPRVRRFVSAYQNEGVQPATFYLEGPDR